MVTQRAPRAYGSAGGLEPRGAIVSSALNSNQFRVALTMALVAFGAVGLAGCHRGKMASAPPAVVVALPVHPDGAAHGSLRFPVEVAARYSNFMSFRVGG